MKIGVFRIGEGPVRLGAVSANRIVDLRSAATATGVEDPSEALRSLRGFLAAGASGTALVAELLGRIGDDEHGASYPLEETTLCAPYVPEAKILCHVINYAKHGNEASINPPELPFFFYKPGSSVIGPSDPVIAHSWSQRVDYEAELAVVIGKKGNDIPTEHAYEYIAGYTILNDISYRDLQFNVEAPSLSERFGMNWTQGKGLDGSCPIGPWLTLTDEVQNPYPLRLRCWVNGELRQDASTSDQIFKIPELISHISRGMTLWPGDIIATGTPSGVGMASDQYLKKGDIIRCAIDGLGMLENEVVDSFASSQSSGAEKGELR
jgi:2-keto-4-pentenoate hydratase/2-oxohepta-3-ene-1,7-dioic acid hydratase in catechol pathway